jgi:hypothetical protein
MTDDSNGDVSQMEHDIRDTQDQIGATVNKLEAQLKPRKIVQSLFGGEAGKWIRMVKSNPMAAAMIGGGIIWLALGTTRR